jgi:RNA polymerase sigma-70 factor (ECF subfamily)
MAEPSDEQLLTVARRGDREALEALLLRYQSVVYRFGMRMCGDPEDAKDILQETLFAMARGVRDFRGASSLSTWLYTVARSFCIKKRRRGRSVARAKESLEAVEERVKQVPDPRRGPEEDVAGRQVEALLAGAIASLEPMYREVLILRDVEGLTAPQVAEIVGVSVDAVKSRLHRARLAVREQVLPYLGLEPMPPPRTSVSCPDVLTMLSRHLEGEITAATCAQMEKHVQECQRCAAACESLKRTLALCHSSQSAQVPQSVQRSVRDDLRRLIAAESLP